MWAAIYLASQIVTFAVCCWASVSSKINGGALGRVCVVVLLFSSLGCIAWAVYWPGEVQRPGVLFSVAVAGMSVRCWWRKTYGPQVHRHIQRIRKCN